jgi:proteasome accessory factor B
MPETKASAGYAHRMRRIERLINLIAALLETERPMTAEQIRSDIAGYDQANFDAFRRAFERDKQDLRSMGIPIELVTSDAFKEQPDAYVIPKDRYYLPELDLEPDELAALKLAADAVLGAGEDATSGLLKLSIDSTTSPWNGSRVVWGADIAAEQPLLGPIWAAQLDRSPISFSYERPNADRSERHLEPYGLVHRRGNWYVVGRDIDRDDVRSFRLSRIRSDITRSEGSYVVPQGFDAASYVAGEAFEIGGVVRDTAVIRFSPKLRWWAERAWPQAAAHETDDGGLEIDIPLANMDALVSWAIGFGDDVEIVSPEEARAALLDHLAPFLEGAP